MLSCILCCHCEETQRNALWLCWHSIRELKGEKPKDVRNVFSKSAKASHHFRCHLQFPEQQSAYQIAFRCTPALLPQIMSGQNIEGFYAHVIVTVIIQLVNVSTCMHSTDPPPLNLPKINAQPSKPTQPPTLNVLWPLESATGADSEDTAFWFRFL